ncbi:hypothetical protein WA026_017234, partial [Henosepilachna vigintioctopunctata]
MSGEPNSRFSGQYRQGIFVQSLKSFEVKAYLHKKYREENKHNAIIVKLLSAHSVQKRKFRAALHKAKGNGKVKSICGLLQE